MQLLDRITEDDMVAAFLRAELQSDRYGEKLRTLLVRDGRDQSVLDDRGESAYRRRLLDEHRAYERREGLFLDFPRDVEWFRALLERDEVLDILYINWHWWLKISGGTRRPRDAARRIRAGEVAGVTAAEHKLRAHPPPLIAVTTPALSPLVLVEGHVRLTAYALFPDEVPPKLEVLVGISDQMAKWCQF